MTLFIKNFDPELSDKLKKSFRQKTLTGAIYCLIHRYYDLLNRMTFLMRENDKAKEASVTPNCRQQCAGCGANKLLCGGKCFEKR